MPNKDKMLISSILVLTGISVGSSASGSEREAAVFEAGQMEVQMVGFFANSGAASPGDPVFSYERRSKQNPHELSWLIEYTFAGRTAENTFDLLKSETYSDVLGVERKKTRVSAYFDKNEPMPLDVRWYPKIDANCGNDEKPQLKMVKLSGNTLQAQILFPACLTDAVRSK